MKLEDIGFYTLSDKRALNTSVDSQMKRCEMIINEYCNFRCPYCRGLADNVFNDRKRKELTFHEIKRNIDLWCDNGPLENIRFSGGEPTYHKDIIDIVKYAKAKDIKKIAISTNGSNKPGIYQKLLEAGCNDFSISLDASDANTGDIMAGNIDGAWNKVVENIRWISKETYVTVGIVLEPANVIRFIDIVNYASNLDVADIRVIPSAQWDGPLIELIKINSDILNKHPILKYRVTNFIIGKRIRGLTDQSAASCPLVLDDSIIAGRDHYPCVIYMREQGKPIGSVGEDMRLERLQWFEHTDTHSDDICKRNCLDVCVDYNVKAQRAINSRRRSVNGL